ncbi:MAG: anthranilate synthase component I family protein, partial [Bacteroidetes bacterium]|nr:anthranilate synthase component I family protein [Bacteroidota bacterium]
MKQTILKNEHFLSAALHLAKNYKHCIILNTGAVDASGPIGDDVAILAAFANNTLPSYDFHSLQIPKNEWIFGYLSYDLKNEFEQLSSNNKAFTHFPVYHFFKPQLLIRISLKGEFQVLNGNSKEFKNALEQNSNLKNEFEEQVDLEFLSETTRLHYLSTVRQIKEEIRNGNVYELNYCLNFSNNHKLDPYKTYHNICHNIPTPFSCMVKTGKDFALSASMERFIKKHKSTVYSQPIKGTTKRHGNNDKIEKEALQSDEKERAENLMIVDLVRNDLNKRAIPGSVNVDELFGVYSYPGVHQMISTVSGKFDEDVDFKQLIKDLFPMGSMTGAPKISAMQLIEKHEDFRRNLYSGSVGYIKP